METPTGMFGIHIGNSFACIALSKDDERVEVLANDTGDRLTPVSVQWTPEQSLVGRSAVLEQFRNNTNTVNRTKQLFNDEITPEEFECLRKEVPFRIHQHGATTKYELVWEGKQHHVSIKEIALSVFRKLHAIGTMSVGGSAELHAVLTVPAYFCPKSIHTVREIAEKAGFNVIQVIDEPSAAVLACVPAWKEGTCVVVRAGGVSVDVTVLSIQQGLYSILSAVHRHSCGGRYVTEMLTDFLAKEFTRQHPGQSITERGKFKLEAAAETAKQILSIQNVAQISVESVGGGLDLNCSVSRPRLDNIINGLLPHIMDALKAALKQATLAAENVSMVVLCGGTMKMPRIQEQIRAFLPKAEVFGAASSNPDELIAMGAAIHARHALKSGTTLPNTLTMDIPTAASQFTVQVKKSDAKEVNMEEVALDTMLPLTRLIEVIAGDSIDVAVDSNTIDNKVVSKNGSLDLHIDRDGSITLQMSNLSINVTS